ncbi:hypothetical protein HZC30_02540 [Candidatus Woesearchaeota archaeon]|nr:hypothetical protein [Candidatus Woesearchaeota archaeon]
MKHSRFNVFIPEGEESYLIYNTFRGSISRVNFELAKMLKNNDLTPLETKDLAGLMEDLTEQGILIAPTFDELNEYSKMHQRWKAHVLVLKIILYQI